MTCRLYPLLFSFDSLFAVAPCCTHPPLPELPCLYLQAIDFTLQYYLPWLRCLQEWVRVALAEATGPSSATPRPPRAASTSAPVTPSATSLVSWGGPSPCCCLRGRAPFRAPSPASANVLARGLDPAPCLLRHLGISASASWRWVG